LVCPALSLIGYAMGRGSKSTRSAVLFLPGRAEIAFLACPVQAELVSQECAGSITCGSESKFHSLLDRGNRLCCHSEKGRSRDQPIWVLLQRNDICWHR